MIGEDAFKGFLDRIAEGIPMRGLFITPTAVLREIQQLTMFNQAGAREFCTVIHDRQRRVIQIDGGVVYLRIAHPYLDRELKGLEWHMIHGLEYLEPYDAACAIRANLKAMVRL